MSFSARHDGSSYRSAGVDYKALDAGKRQALTAALATSGLLEAFGGRANDDSRGETAFVFEFGRDTLAFVLEGLGTKSMIARQLEDRLGYRVYADVAYDTVAAIVNDLCCVGALPLVVSAYFVIGSADWYDRPDRQTALVSGWQEACIASGATWGGGESPALPGLVTPGEIELAGSAVGSVPSRRRPILGDDLTSGDEIVFVASKGLHANGSSLARKIALELSDGYGACLPSGRTFGEALLDRSQMYVPLVAELMRTDVDIHYLSHITGHGLQKLMRARRPFTYRITALPDVPEVLNFMVDHEEMTPTEAYATFNMGCGFAIYCAAGHGATVVRVAEQLSVKAMVAGVVEDGARRILLPNDVVFESGDMDLAPQRAA
jgi:phosphoribosylformylglycinamidine cyclo-ligase